MKWWEPEAMLGRQPPMGRGPSSEIKLVGIEAAAAALGTAMVSAFKAFVETTAAFRGLDDVMREISKDRRWVCEHRRRIWFWRGLIGEFRPASAASREAARRQVGAWPPFAVSWCLAGRRTGELLAGLRHR